MLPPGGPLNRRQHSGQRQSSTSTPSALLRCFKRQPDVELTNASPSFSGAGIPQPTHFGLIARIEFSSSIQTDLNGTTRVRVKRRPDLTPISFDTRTSASGVRDIWGGMRRDGPRSPDDARVSRSFSGTGTGRIQGQA